MISADFYANSYFWKCNSQYCRKKLFYFFHTTRIVCNFALQNFLQTHEKSLPKQMSNHYNEFDNKMFEEEFANYKLHDHSACGIQYFTIERDFSNIIPYLP